MDVSIFLRDLYIHLFEMHYLNFGSLNLNNIKNILIIWIKGTSPTVLRLKFWWSEILRVFFLNELKVVCYLQVFYNLFFITFPLLRWACFADYEIKWGFSGDYRIFILMIREKFILKFSVESTRSIACTAEFSLRLLTI